MVVPQEAKVFLQDSRCVLCDCEMIDSHSADDRQAGRCALGHALCADCTSQYVEKTLLPQRIVWWDRIKCLGPECTEYMEGASVQRCIPRRLVEGINAAQREVVAVIGAGAKRDHATELARLERVRASQTADDRASEAYLAEFTRPCPRCRAPSVKEIGCKHIEECRRCLHEYCWVCGCDWVRGHLSVTCTPR